MSEALNLAIGIFDSLMYEAFEDLAPDDLRQFQAYARTWLPAVDPDDTQQCIAVDVPDETETQEVEAITDTHEMPRANGE